MTHDERLSSVLNNPADTETLSIYADWLDDHHDSRAEFVRGQIELRELYGSDQAHDLEPALATLRKLYPSNHLPWVNQLEQAAAFCRNLCADNLASQRFVFDAAADRGYNTERFKALPPLDVDRLGRHFEWLSKPPIRKRGRHTEQTRDDMQPWAELIDELKQKGFGFPKNFELLMLDTELQSFLPSKTDDYFMTPEHAKGNVTPLNDGSLYLPFYADSQWSVVYGLRLNAGEESYIPVLCGHPDYVDDEDNRFDYDVHLVVGSSLETFVCQMWLDNHRWYALNSRDGKRELTEEEQRLVDFLKKSK